MIYKITPPYSLIGKGYISVCKSISTDLIFNQLEKLQLLQRKQKETFYIVYFKNEIRCYLEDNLVPIFLLRKLGHQEEVKSLPKGNVGDVLISNGAEMEILVGNGGNRIEWHRLI